MKAFGFGKHEKLKSRKAINALFAEGKSFVVAPVRVKYSFVPLAEGTAPVQAGVSVSKKSFKRAVARNRIKRLLREAYRLQKRTLLQTAATANRQLVVFFMYTGKSLPTFELIYNAMTACLNQLQQKVLAHEKTR